MKNKLEGKKIYFRFDFGGRIGRGHFSRCRALAEAFALAGAAPIFVVRKRPSIALERLPFQTLWLPDTDDAESADVCDWRAGSEEQEAAEMLAILNEPALVVLDHYALGYEWQKQVKKAAHRLVLFQDAYDPNVSVDILINYNLLLDPRYDEFTWKQLPPKCLIGTQFAPLALAYQENHKLRFSSQEQVRRVGVYLGGIDLAHLGKMAIVMSGIPYFSDKNITWVVNTETDAEILAKAFGSKKPQIEWKLSELIEIYENSDLFIGSCGVSFLERACMGLWQINFCAASNQREIARFINDQNLSTILGELPTMSVDEIKNAFELALSRNEKEIFDQVQKSFLLVDGYGSIRIVNECAEVIW